MDLQLKLKDTEDELKEVKEILKQFELDNYAVPHGNPYSAKDYLSSLERKESDLTNQITTLINKIPQQGNIIIKFNGNLILVIKNNE